MNAHARDALRQAGAEAGRKARADAPPLRLDQDRRTNPRESQPSNSFEFAPLVVCVVEVSAALSIEAASVSTYRLVSDRVSSQPIPDLARQPALGGRARLRRGVARRSTRATPRTWARAMGFSFLRCCGLSWW